MIFSWYVERKLMKQYGCKKRVEEHIKNMPGWKKALIGLGDGLLVGCCIIVLLASLEYIAVHI